MSKTCNKCNQSHPLTNFRISNGYTRGECKPCERLLRTEHKRTKLGLICQMYSHQKSASKKRGHTQPTYTKQWLYEYLIGQPLFSKLYREWVESGYLKKLIPSVDRKSNHMGYTENNIQLMTWEENSMLAKIGMITGINTSSPQLKRVKKIANGVETIYHSVTEAARGNNITQSGVSASIKNNHYSKGARYLFI